MTTRLIVAAFILPKRKLNHIIPFKMLFMIDYGIFMLQKLLFFNCFQIEDQSKVISKGRLCPQHPAFCRNQPANTPSSKSAQLSGTPGLHLCHQHLCTRHSPGSCRAWRRTCHRPLTQTSGNVWVCLGICTPVLSCIFNEEMSCEKRVGLTFSLLFRLTQEKPAVPTWICVQVMKELRFRTVICIWKLRDNTPRVPSFAAM